MATTSLATASVISVNFMESASGHPNQIIAADTTAGGGAGLAATNWNNVATLEGSAGDLIDVSGSATSAGIVWTAAGMWGDGSANAGADAGGSAQIMRGYLDDGATDGSTGVAFTLSGITYAEYIVALYFSTDFSDTDPGFKMATVDDGTSSYGVQTSGLRESWGENSNLGPHNTAASGVLTGSSVSITLPHRFAPDELGGRRGTVAGLQVIQVPEPSVVTLSGLAALGLAFRRRRG